MNKFTYGISAVIIFSGAEKNIATLPGIMSATNLSLLDLNSSFFIHFVTDLKL
jgi:hypothetical protein